MLDKNKITILCKVVDNFGDIGVVYRLARALSDLRPELELTLVVSNLESFHKMASQIDPSKKIQDFRYKNSTWKILDWNLETENLQGATASPSGVPPFADAHSLTATSGLHTLAQSSSSQPQSSTLSFQFSIILECFQCGRPDWLENQLFSPEFTDTVQIIQIDYLTAEEYADEFHLLKSGTRKTNIKKIFFMPGFTEKTAGLIINEIKNFRDAPALPSDLTPSADSHSITTSAGFHQIRRNDSKSSEEACDKNGSENPKKYFSILFFAYEDDCTSIVKGISDFQDKIREKDDNFSVRVFLTEGKSCIPFEKSWEKANSPFEIEKLPFLQQEEFDYFITTMDFLFVRGEDSLARAALCGLPYVWQAYKQDENYQLVKVNALIDRMKEYFEPEIFAPIQSFWQSYNDYENPTKSEPLTQMLSDTLNQKNTKGFRDFAAKLHENGNLATHLLNYIDGLDI